jgi:hypothetical protein
LPHVLDLQWILADQERREVLVHRRLDDARPLREGGAAQSIQARLAVRDLDVDEADPRRGGEDGFDVGDFKGRQLLVGHGRVQRRVRGGLRRRSGRSRHPPGQAGGAGVEGGPLEQVASMHEKAPRTGRVRRGPKRSVRGSVGENDGPTPVRQEASVNPLFFQFAITFGPPAFDDQDGFEYSLISQSATFWHKRRARP